MTLRLLNRLAVILRVIFLLSAIVLFILALNGPETEWLDSKSRDDWMNLINNAPDIERLRNIASNILSFSWITHGPHFGCAAWRLLHFSPLWLVQSSV